MPFIQVADVTDSMSVNPDTNRHISDKAKKQSVYIPKGTLIITLQGTIGRVAITTYDAYIDRTLLIIQEIDKNILQEFLMYALYMKFSEEKQTADGSIIKTITKETLTDFFIKVPPIKEQAKIVRTLMSLDARIRNEEIQSYPDCDEYEEYSNKINVQKDIIIWFTNTITNLITDEEEKRRFNTLRPDCVE